MTHKEPPTCPGHPACSTSFFKLLANPALAQSFLSDPDGTFDGIDLNQVDINVVVAEINNSASLLNSSGVASIAIPALLPGMTAGELLDSFVTSFYADHPDHEQRVGRGDVTQAFASAGGIAVSAGEEVEDVNAAAGGSVAVDGEVEESGIANGGGIAAGGDIEFEEIDDIIVGNGNVGIIGEDNDCRRGRPDQQRRVARKQHRHQRFDDPGSRGRWHERRRRRHSSTRTSPVTISPSPTDRCMRWQPTATSPRVTDSVATDGPVADGPYSQAAGEDSNLVKDDDNFTPTITQSAPVTFPASITQTSGPATSGRAARAAQAVPVARAVPAVPAALVAQVPPAAPVRVRPAELPRAALPRVAPPRVVPARTARAAAPPRVPAVPVAAESGRTVGHGLRRHRPSTVATPAPRVVPPRVVPARALAAAPRAALPPAATPQVVSAEPARVVTAALVAMVAPAAPRAQAAQVGPAVTPVTPVTRPAATTR